MGRRAVAAVDARVEGRLVRGFVDQHAGVLIASGRAGVPRPWMIVEGDAVGLRASRSPARRPRPPRPAGRRSGGIPAGLAKTMPTRGKSGSLAVQAADREVMDEGPVKLFEPLGPLVALAAGVGDQVVAGAGHFVPAAQFSQQHGAELGKRVAVEAAGRLLEVGRRGRDRRSRADRRGPAGGPGPCSRPAARPRSLGRRRKALPSMRASRRPAPRRTPRAAHRARDVDQGAGAGGRGPGAGDQGPGTGGRMSLRLTIFGGIVWRTLLSIEV